MSKVHSGSWLVAVVGAFVAVGAGWAGPALALGHDPVAAPAAPAAQAPRRTKAEVAAAVAACGGDELCEAAIYLGAALESNQRAIHETLDEHDPKAAKEEIGDAWFWLREAHGHLTLAQGD